MSVISSVRSAVYSSKTLNIVDSDYKDRNSFGMKSGKFTLNGKEIVVKKGATLESLSQQINKNSGTTGIKAKIVEKDNGYKLQLISRNKLVQISDPKGVLKNLYDKNHIGNSSKHLIQVIGGELYYNKSLPSQSLIRPLLKLNKQYSPEPNLFVENTLVNLNEVDEDQVSAIDDEECLGSDSPPSSLVDLNDDYEVSTADSEEFGSGEQDSSSLVDLNDDNEDVVQQINQPEVESTNQSANKPVKKLHFSSCTIC